jgi:drug/metabolite transporter (DMT)-like permease
LVSKFLILLLSIFMLSTAPALVKMINLSPLVGLSWRLSIVSLALLPFAFGSLKKLRRSTVLKIGFVSSVLFVHFWTWFAGVRLLNVSYTATIFAINPVFAALLGKVILKEKFQLRYAIAMVTSFVGISYAFLGNRLEVEGSFSVFGCILILVSAFFYALYMVLSKKLRASVDNSLYTFTLNSLAGVIGWIAVAVAFYFNGSENMSEVIPAQEQVGFLVALAIGPSLLGHTLMIYSLPSFNINFVSVLKLLSPISASLIGVLVFGDIIDTRLVLGFCLVLSGVCLALPLKRRTKS